MMAGISAVLMGVLLILTPVNAATITLTSPNVEAGGQFGFSVASANGLLIVGAAGESVNGLFSAGRTYFFNATKGSFAFALVSPNVQSFGRFGFSVASVNGRVIIGADGETVSGLVGAGRVYIF